ncbi:MAG TPA: tyrosine-type recombinase/integrase [Alphaproteobacteria bacterium]|nr:tyrosine-type recombinase/integrase [Alphaproteobacteria bacterium]
MSIFGEPRTVPMHPIVAEELAAIWSARGRPDLGHVFLNRLGRPYADTRDYKWPARRTRPRSRAWRGAALRPNGGSDFRIHDWRHHRASHCVMSGMDLLTLRRLGGWRSLRMVERYADVSVEHMAEAIARVKAPDKKNVSQPQTQEGNQSGWWHLGSR